MKKELVIRSEFIGTQALFDIHFSDVSTTLF
jgi:hypothetical protein